MASASIGESAAKKRKIRKGTHSCWECKRRKIRCTFDDSSDTICSGCQRRHTPCLSQEFPDDPQPAGTGRQFDRIVRVEALVEQLAKRVLPSPSASSDANGYLSPAERNRSTRTSGTSGSVASATPGCTTPGGSDCPQARTTGDPEAQFEDGVESLPHHIANDGGPLTAPFGTLAQVTNGTSSSWSSSPSSSDHVVVSKILYDALPSQSDADKIIGASESPGLLFIQMLMRPWDELEREDGAVAAARLSRLPPRTSHPVIIARKLLHLALCLQYNKLTGEGLELCRRQTAHQALRRLAGAAVRHVNRSDDLVGSLEGLECLMLEGAFQANLGNMRRGWLCFRRAITFAQLMRLHRGRAPTLRVLEADNPVDPRYLWYRLQFAERHMSLLLGMPPATTDETFARGRDFEADSSVGRIERIHTAVAGRICVRTCFGDVDYGLTAEIDREMQHAAASMPEAWWLVPRLGEGGLGQIIADTSRILSQTYHYSILSQLHLPYLLASSSLSSSSIGGGGGGAAAVTPAQALQSRLTCATASREVLARFVAFRTFNRAANSCRGIDFMAIMASMTLVLAHVEGARNGLAALLAHQRAADRDMMGQVLAAMDALHGANGDALSHSSALILRRLLAIEAEVACGGQAYRAQRDDDDDDDDGGEGATESLRLCVPYFGMIKVAKEGVSRGGPADAGVGGVGGDGFAGVGARSPRSYDMRMGVPAAFGVAACVQTPRHPTGSTGGAPTLAGHDNGGGWQGLPQDPNGPAPNGGGLAGYPQPQPQPQPYQFEFAQPALDADADDWAFQGVDMAFWDSLMMGDAGVGWDDDDEAARQFHGRMGS